MQVTAWLWLMKKDAWCVGVAGNWKKNAVLQIFGLLEAE
jgi:hypothetical protein